MKDDSEVEITEVMIGRVALAELQRAVGEWLSENESELKDGGHGDVADITGRILRLCSIHQVQL